MTSHRSDVSYPGGRIDNNEGAVVTALREAEEEIGLKPCDVDVWGPLTTLYTTVCVCVCVTQ